MEELAVNKTILVVDDEDDVRESVRDAFGDKMDMVGNGGGPECMPWVVEVYLDHCIVASEGQLFSIPFKWDDATLEATLGKAEQVRVEYTPVGG